MNKFNIFVANKNVGMRNILIVAALLGNFVAMGQNKSDIENYKNDKRNQIENGSYQDFLESTIKITDYYKKKKDWELYLKEVTSSTKTLKEVGRSALMIDELEQAIDICSDKVDTNATLFRTALNQAGEIYYLNQNDANGIKYMSRLHNILVQNNLNYGEEYINCTSKLLEMTMLVGHPKANDYLLELYHFYSKNDNSLELAKLYTIISGSILLKDWQLANKLCLEADKIYQNHTEAPWRDVAKNYKVLAQTYTIAYRNADAILYFKKAIELAYNQKPEDLNFVCEVMGNLCSAYLNARQIDSALFYSYKHLEISRKLFGKINHYTTDVYSNLARSYLGKGMLDSSIFILIMRLRYIKNKMEKKALRQDPITISKQKYLFLQKNMKKLLNAWSKV
jgi:hypothetical protein